MAKELSVYIIEYVESLSSTSNSTGSIKQARSSLKHFDVWVSEKRPEGDFLTFTVEDYEDFCSWITTKYSRASVNRICSIVTALQRFHKLPEVVSLRKIAGNPSAVPFTQTDFIEDKEYKKLEKSFNSVRGLSVSSVFVHKELANRNIAMLHLMRFHGLTARQLSSISMNDINLAQKELTVRFQDGQTVVHPLSKKIHSLIAAYLQEIPPVARPRYHTEDPLFVAYNNTYMRYQVEDGIPKRLAERSIMKVIRVEVARAGLRELSAVQLRNTAILDWMKEEKSDAEIMEYFGITSSKHLNKFRKYKQKHI